MLALYAAFSVGRYACGMAKIKLHKTVLPVFIGFILKSVSRSFELRGDLARTLGDDGGALRGHVAALLMLIAAVICFGYGLYHFFKGLRSKPEEPEPYVLEERVVDPVEASTEGTSFDADAIMARYMANRDRAPARAVDSPAADEAVRPAMPAARPAFGRKRS